jgi:ABC-type uncharacterized transport system fused permease/ATPase subunit
LIYNIRLHPNCCLTFKIVGIVVLVLFLWGSTAEDRGREITKSSKAKAQRVHKFRGSGNVDAAFMEKIQGLIKVVVPSWTCKESKYLIILTLLLVLRTQMSIWLADVNGKIVKAIVERNFTKFCYRVSIMNKRFLTNFICFL